MSELLQGEVTGFSSEGQGLLRQGQLVVFIPFTAPGDRIRYQISTQKKNFARGQLVDILQASPARVTPLCRYFGQCGGCQLQHIHYSEQLKYKQQIVLDALKRIAKMPNSQVEPVIPATLNWAYRRHVTLKIRPEEGHLKIGYIEVDQHTVLPIESCPIFISDHDTAIKELQSFLKVFLLDLTSEGRATLFKTHSDQLILSLQFEKNLKHNPEIPQVFLQNHSRWAGILLSVGHKKETWGQTQTHISINQLKWVCSPEVFTQNHPEQSTKIYHQITELLKGSTKSILDLYCGIGISSLLLAQQGHGVTGMESNPLSITLAKESARLNGLSATFMTGEVENLLNQLPRTKYDAILINPPRIGISPIALKRILRLKPREMIYISCMPSTLARDLALICSQGYQIQLIQPYDMFPQTYHVETLVHLILK